MSFFHDIFVFRIYGYWVLRFMKRREKTGTNLAVSSRAASVLAGQSLWRRQNSDANIRDERDEDLKEMEC